MARFVYEKNRSLHRVLAFCVQRPSQGAVHVQHHGIQEAQPPDREPQHQQQLRKDECVWEKLLHVPKCVHRVVRPTDCWHRVQDDRLKHEIQPSLVRREATRATAEFLLDRPLEQARYGIL